MECGADFSIMKWHVLMDSQAKVETNGLEVGTLETGAHSPGHLIPPPLLIVASNKLLMTMHFQTFSLDS